MSQINNSPTIDQFKKLSQGMGSITQGAENNIIRGPRGTWFRSLFNVGDARQKNIETIAALKNAINQDEKYKFVAGDILARLGTMSTKFPLSCSKVRYIINKLDKNVDIKIKENKSIFSVLLINNLSKEKLNALADNVTIISEETQPFMDCFNIRFQSKFISAMKLILAKQQKDAPLEQLNSIAMENNICRAIGHIRSMYTDINSRSFDDDIKMTLYDSLLTDETIKTQEEFDQDIIKYTNKKTIDKLVNFNDIKWLLNEALYENGLDKYVEEMNVNSYDEVTDKEKNIFCIIQAIIKERIEELHRTESAPLQKETLDRCVDKIKKEYINIVKQMTSSEQLKSYFLRNISTITKNMLSNRYDARFQETIDIINNLHTVDSDMDIERNIRIITDNLYKLQGLTHSDNERDSIQKEDIGNIVDRIICTAPNPHEHLAALYRTLTQNEGAKVYAKMNATQNMPTAHRPYMLLHNLIYAIGERIGEDPQKISATLKGLQPQQICTMDTSFNKNIIIRDNLFLNIERARGELARGLNVHIVTELVKSLLNKAQDTYFYKDLSRQGSVYLDTIAVPSPEDKSTYSSKVESGSLEDKKENHLEILFKKARNSFTAYISDNQYTDYDKAPLEVQNEVNIVLAIFNQNIYNHSIVELNKPIRFLSYTGEELPIVFSFHDRKDSLSLHKEHNGDLNFSISFTLQIQGIGDIDKIIQTDNSYETININFTIRAEDIKNLAKQNFEEISKLGSEKIKKLCYEDIEKNFRLAIQNFIINQKIELHKEEQKQETRTDKTNTVNAAEIDHPEDVIQDKNIVQ